MIGLLFRFGQDTIEFRIEGNRLLIRKSDYGSSFIPFTNETVQFNKSGVLKEFPDLKDHLEWKRIAYERFKEKISGLQNEDAIAEYILMDLTKFGYVPLYKQKKGYRPQKIEWHG